MQNYKRSAAGRLKSAGAKAGTLPKQGRDDLHSFAALPGSTSQKEKTRPMKMMNVMRVMTRLK